MNLRNRGGGDRSLVEGLEQGFERQREFRFDRGARLAPGNGGSRSWRLREIGGDLLADRSARVDSIWPSLINAGPISSRAAASRWPGAPPGERAVARTAAATRR